MATFSDYFTLAESFVKKYLGNPTFTETFTVNESFAKAHVQFQAFNDVLSTLVDSFTEQRTACITATEVFTLVESYLQNHLYNPASFSDSITQTDTFTKGLLHNPAFTDALTLTDSATEVYQQFVSLSDVYSVVDSIVEQLSHTLAFDEVIAVVDVFGRVVYYNATGTSVDASTAIATGTVIIGVLVYLAYAYAHDYATVNARILVKQIAKARAVCGSLATAFGIKPVIVLGTLAGHSVASASTDTTAATATSTDTSTADATPTQVYNAVCESDGLSTCVADMPIFMDAEGIINDNFNVLVGTLSGDVSATGHARSYSYVHATPFNNEVDATATATGSSTAIYTELIILAEADPIFGYTLVQGSAAATVDANAVVWGTNFVLPFALRYKPMTGTLAGAAVATAAAE
jgi:hypothetical protein